MSSISLGRAGVATAATMGLVLTGIWLSFDDAPEALLPIFGFAAVYLAPATLGLIGHRRHDGPTLMAAAILCLLASVTSFGGPTLPFVIPAVLLAGAAIGRRWRRPSSIAAGIAGVLVVAAWFAAVRVDGWTAAAPLLVALALVTALAARGGPRPIIASDGDAEDPRPPGQ